MSDQSIDQEFATDPFLQTLTDALRAGPASAEWHAAVGQLNSSEIDPEKQYMLLVQVRENLAAGKAYRAVRPGAGFTTRVFARIDADELAKAKSPLSASFITYIGAGLVVGAIAVLLIWLIQAGTSRSSEDLTELFFSTTKSSTSLQGSLPAGWRVFGPLAVDTSKGLMPSRTGSGTDYQGGGIVSTNGQSPTEPFAVEATFQFQHVSDEVVPQLFVTDNPNFSADRGVSPHELVWFVRGGQEQVALPDGQLAGATKKVIDGQSISVRIVVGNKKAMVSCDGTLLWTGASQLPETPRYVGVRLLCRKDEKRSIVAVKQLRVLGK